MKKRILASILAASVAAAAMSVSAFAELGASDYTDNTATAPIADEETVTLTTDSGAVLDVATADLPEGVTEVTFTATSLGTETPEVDTILSVLGDYLGTSDFDYTTDDVEIVDSFDLSLLDQNGEAIENASFAVSVPTDNENVNAVIYTDGDTIEVYRAAYANGYVEFTVPHFSTYALAVVPEEVLDDIAVDNDEAIDDDADADDDAAADDTTDDTTTDGDKNVATGVALAVVPVAIAGVAAVIARKRK